MQPLFHTIKAALESAQVPFIIVGGYAANALGVYRGTKDLDLMIVASQEARAAAALEALGCTLFQRSDAFARYRLSSQVAMDIDLMLVSAETFGEVLARSRAVVIQGVTLKVPAPEDLIAMKLHACKYGGFRREIKDLYDIVALIRGHAIDVESDSFRELCLRFGTESLYRDLLKASAT